MQQTALNIIAIGIFSMTLLVLLTPILNINPMIPAASTLAVLSLITVDTLTLQGKGANLFLDWVASFSPQHRQRIVRHEAGHFLVAYFLGIPIEGYTLNAWEALQQGQPGVGGVKFDTKVLEKKAKSPGEMRLLLDRFCTVWMAGIAAESLIYATVEGGGEDKAKVKQALIDFGHPEAEYQQKEAWALLQAKTLIEKYASAYEALVAAMTKRTSVQECAEIIQENCGEVDAIAS
ncbi:MAG: ATP-dependent Zn protease [Oscillatoria sp. PMC 1068.18]|nr:ATP-dependent Zn protease [Oscillatoria sp. PMC 1076.18]MEC4988308.1 ATP-dependent Zn protease [Oscillatoria sp. PMC 1068.18]